MKLNKEWRYVRRILGKVWRAVEFEPFKKNFKKIKLIDEAHQKAEKSKLHFGKL